jgi:hypothetical protein
MNLQDLLKDEFAQKVIREFGIEGEADETKAQLLAQLGENISGRILLKVSKILPADKRAEFEALVEGDNPEALRHFLSPYVEDFGALAQAEAQKEIERTKAYMLEESELAVTGGGQ